MYEYETVANLPDNPLNMPPPYWRSGGTIFHITDSLDNLCMLLKSLREVLPKVNKKLDGYFKSHLDFVEDDEEFSDICDPLWELEHKIQLKCELAVFMAAIEAEDKLNQIAVFNLHKDIVESIERLRPPEKLLVISSSLTGDSIKDSNTYESLKRLVKWRNAFAHGHCTDRPTKSLRHNHLIEPDNFPTVPKDIEHMLTQLEGYLMVVNYLSSISKNEYTSGTSAHDDEIKGYLKEVKKNIFTYDFHGVVYELKYNE